MSDYNIQMHSYNGEDYDNLYPKTIAKNVYLDNEYTLDDFWKGEIPDPILNNNSFEVIRKVSDAGIGASIWSVGDRKGVALSGTIGQGSYTTTLNKTYYMSILGFDHNSTREGSNRIHFQFGWTDLTGGTQIAFCTWSSNDTWGTSTQNGAGGCMNTTNTNTNGWKSSIMRTSTCNVQFLACLPKELRDVLKTVKKWTDNVGGNQNNASSMSETEDTIFLPSEWEVFGSRSYANSAESTYQVQYDYYKGVSAGSASKNAFTAAGKIRYNHQNTSQAVDWWERSPRASNTTFFCRVLNYGGASSNNANLSYGFAPCLCI